MRRYDYIFGAKFYFLIYTTMIGIGSLANAGLNAASSLMGSFAKNKMLKEQEKLVQNRMDRLQNEYDRDYNADATQKADTQRLLALTKESLKRSNKNPIGMMSTEQEAARADSAANAMTNAAANIAVANEAKKQQIKDNFQNKYDALEDKKASLRSQRQSGWDIAGNALGAAGQGFGTGTEMEDAFRDMKDKY